MSGQEFEIRWEPDLPVRQAEPQQATRRTEDGASEHQELRPDGRVPEAM